MPLFSRFTFICWNFARRFLFIIRCRWVRTEGFIRRDFRYGTDAGIQMSALDYSLKRVSIYQELEHIRAGVVPAYVAGSLGGKHRFERSLGCENRLSLCWASNDFTTGINNVAFARVVVGVEITIALRNILYQTHAARQNDIAAGLGGKCSREKELARPE